MESSPSYLDPRFAMTGAAVRNLMGKYKTIAVVGLSTNQGKPSHYVPKYLKENGYTIIPVNPVAKEDLLGEKVYASLKEIPVPVEIVQIFRPSDDVPPVVDEAVEIGAKVVWMQEGIIHNQAARRAREAGLEVVMDRCMMKVHKGA